MGWIRVEGAPREIITIDAETGKQVAVVDMQVATAADLPALGDAVGNFIIAGGSTAQIVEADTVTFVTLSGTAVMFYTPVTDGTGNQVFSSHFGTRKSGSFPIVGNLVYNGDSNKNMIFRMSDDTTITTVDGFKAWLAAQYAAETPVTVWYILAEPETGIVNEPLCKIGDYADELSSTDAGATIPTVKGQNTLTVGTELQPSEMTIVYRN